MPTRYLKPGIRDSERFEAIKSPDAEILYFRLLVSVDDFGRADARPLMVKSLCFPIRLRATADKCMQWLKDLENAGLIVLYEVDGKPYLQVTRWDNKPRSERSKYPDPRTVADKCMQMLPVTVTVTETETGTDIASSDKSLSAADSNGSAVEHIPLADNTEWGVPKDYLLELERAYPAVDGVTTLKEIRAWCVSNPQKRKTRRGVMRFINRWFEREQNRGA